MAITFMSAGAGRSVGIVGHRAIVMIDRQPRGNWSIFAIGEEEGDEILIGNYGTLKAAQRYVAILVDNGRFEDEVFTQRGCRALADGNIDVNELHALLYS